MLGEMVKCGLGASIFYIDYRHKVDIVFFLIFSRFHLPSKNYYTYTKTVMNVHLRIKKIDLIENVFIEKFFERKGSYQNLLSFFLLFLFPTFWFFFSI